MRPSSKAPFRPARLLAAACALAATFSPEARAQVDVRPLAAAVSAAAPSGPMPAAHRGLGLLGRPDLSAIVEFPDGAFPTGLGLPRIGARFTVLRGPLAELDAFAAQHPEARVTWSPPLRPLLDKVAGWTGATAFRNTTDLTGKGVIVGIVDTGVDVLHRDLRNDDGTTRIAYLVDFGSKAAGLHPELEQQCTAHKLTCSVFTAEDIDARIARGRANDLSHDTIGHGTHVASLAAGNGGLEKKYVGMAPEATVVVARVIDSANDIGDAGVLAATSMIFSIAETEGQKQGKERLPAVVNMSLGSDFGPHDGTAPLERGLAALVGPQFPGRAIAVAAGNSAALLTGVKTFPSPLGVHTEVNVPVDSGARIPIVMELPPTEGELVHATIYVWIGYRPGDDLAIGVDRRSGSWVAPVHPGNGGTFGNRDVLAATIVNGALGSLGLGLKDGPAAIVIIEGEWAKDETFALRLSGSGTANLWVQAEGDLSQAAGGGAAFPGASKEFTTTIPAGHPDLIAVGATLNRTEWVDRTGQDVVIGTFGSVVDPPLDSVAFFSSAGPTTDSRLKPDVLAPGGFVVGAMSRDADPADSLTSVFSQGFCDPPTDCAVVDDAHAVTLGTSMASPIVAGAIALLFEGNPDLTQNEILTLLQAGARRPRGLIPLQSQLGAGALSLPGVLDVQQAMQGGRGTPPSAHESWLTLGEDMAHPDPAWSIPGVLQLRDDVARTADGVDDADLDVDVENGHLSQPLTRAAPGYYRFSVAASRGSGGSELHVAVNYRGHLMLSSSLPIAVDVGVERSGFFARGGCSIAMVSARRDVAPVALLLGALIAGRARRRSRAARRARSPGRRDS